MTSDIKFMKPPAGKALVYILRPSTFGFLLSFVVSCDKKKLGVTKGKTFLYTVLDPGTHLFESKSETIKELHLEVQAGKIYFIEQLMTLKIASRRLELIDAKSGRRKLKGCKLSEFLENNTNISPPTTTHQATPLQTMPHKTTIGSDIKNMKPPEGKALVYILRPSIDGFLVSFKVSINNNKLGEIKAKNFLYAILDPGSHLFKEDRNIKSNWNLDINAGEILFLETFVVQTMGLKNGRCKFNLLTEKSGRKKLKRCNLSKKQYIKF